MTSHDKPGEGKTEDKINGRDSQSYSEGETDGRPYLTHHAGVRENENLEVAPARVEEG